MTIGPHKILTPKEVTTVVRDLRRRRTLAAKRKRKDLRWPVKMQIFFLATFHGLRAKEIAGLNVGDLHRVTETPDVDRPYLFVKAETTKGMHGYRRSREVRMTWPTRDVYSDMRELLAMRLNMGAKPTDPFVCSLEPRSVGKRLRGNQIDRFFKSACKCFSRKGGLRVHVHMGRHTYATTAIHTWRRTLEEVQKAMGHRSVATTSIYLHALDDPTRDWGGGEAESRKAG